jgi:hypothetical protein
LAIQICSLTFSSTRGPKPFCTPIRIGRIAADTSLVFLAAIGTTGLGHLFTPTPCLVSTNTCHKTQPRHWWFLDDCSDDILVDGLYDTLKRLAFAEEHEKLLMKCFPVLFTRASGSLNIERILAAFSSASWLSGGRLCGVLGVSLLQRLSGLPLGRFVAASVLPIHLLRCPCSRPFLVRRGVSQIQVANLAPPTFHQLCPYQWRSAARTYPILYTHLRVDKPWEYQRSLEVS